MCYMFLFIFITFGHYRQADLPPHQVGVCHALNEFNAYALNVYALNAFALNAYTLNAYALNVYALNIYALNAYSLNVYAFLFSPLSAMH